MTQAEVIAAEWIEAFNLHDLPRILSHYDDDVVLISPVFQQLTGRPQVTGKAELERYFAVGLERYPDLKFTLLDVLAGVGSVCVRYHTTVGDRTACECMEFNERGRVTRVLCHYA